MRQRGRIGAMAMLAALAWPGAAAAQDAFIRIEAKRGAAAEAAVADWRERFPDVVTVTLANGMTGIVLGPQTPAEAAARMARLKAEGAIPADSYLTGPGGEAPLAGLTAALAAAEALAGASGGPDADDAPAAGGTAADGTASGETSAEGTAPPAEGEDDAAASPGEAPAADDAAGQDGPPGADSARTGDVPGPTEAAEDRAPAGGGMSARRGGASPGAIPRAAAGLRGAVPDAVPSTPSAPSAPEDAAPEAVSPEAEAAPAPDTSPRHIQLQATPGRASAEGALVEWRRTFPGAQLWRIPGGWYAVALPAQRADRAEERLAALKAERSIPRDAFLVTPGELGELVQPQPGTPADGAARAPGTGIPAPGRGAAGATGDAGTGPAARPIMDDPSTSPADATAAAPSEPARPAVMPPIAEVQRALRWAGLYDGALDGQSGPGTRAAIDAQVEATGGTDTPAEAMAALIAERAAWRRGMGLETLTDEATGLSLLAPAAKLAFDRTQRALSIYGPKDGSGAALILFAQPGGQQEMEDLAGLVTALGWVPHPERDIARDRFTLTGANELHIGHAEGRVQDGMAEGWVLIWPAADAANARRLAVEAGESFARTGPPEEAEAPSE